MSKSEIIGGERAKQIGREIEAENKRIRGEELAERKAQAATNGKEPFDLDEFAKYIDLTWKIEYAAAYPQVVPREAKVRLLRTQLLRDVSACNDIKRLRS
jgi:hypothetical protein